MENISQNIIFLSSTQLVNEFKSDKLFKLDSIFFCTPDKNPGFAPDYRGRMLHDFSENHNTYFFLNENFENIEMRVLK